MTIPNHEHLFEQADTLLTAHTVGQPRQVDLRRAISSTYYGVFHFILAALADEFIGPTQRLSARYNLVYRSVDHRVLKEVCTEVQKPRPAQRFAPYMPTTGFDPIIRQVATTTRELQELRHLADYDPASRFLLGDVRLVIATARSAVRPFDQAGQEHRRLFLTLLLCTPR